MLDFDESFDLSDMKPHSFERLATKVTDNIICEELAATSADVDLEQSSVP